MTTYLVAIFVTLHVFVAKAVPDELPQFLDQPASITVKQGSRARLKCAGSTFGSSVTWFFNGIQLAEGDKSSVSRRKRAKGISETVTMNDVNNVLAQGRFANMPNYYRSKSFSHKKHRRRRGSKLKRHRREAENMLSQNKNYIFKTPFRWKRSSEKNKYINLQTRSRRSVTLPDNYMRGVDIREGRLIISQFSDQYAGKYHCEVKNNVGTIRSRTATVTKAEIADFEDMDALSVTASKGEAAVIPCKLPPSSPPAFANWKIDDGPWIQKSSDDYTILLSGSLLIHNVSETSGTRFQCAAYNTVLKSRKNAPTIVTLVSTGASRSPQLIHPSSSSSKNFSFSSGYDLVLPCISSDGQSAVWSGEKVTRGMKKTKVGLTINSISVDEAGDYSCSVSNHDAVYHINVAKSPNVRATSSSTFSTSVKARARFILQCEVGNTNNIVNWSWYKDGRRLMADSSTEINDSTLTLAPVTGQMQGVYQCMAHNLEGEDFTTFYVEVKDDDTTSVTEPPETKTSEKSKSSSYFNAPIDENGLAAPVVTSKLRTTDPVSYRLSWKLPNDATRVETIAIRWGKSTIHTPDSSQPTYKWSTQSVPAEKTFYLIDDLEPLSLYQLELVSISEEGKSSQIVTTSFRTGETNNERPEIPKPIENNNIINDPPTRPETPSVTPISVTSVSLMWIPPSNGGSPIEGYRVEMREIGKREWRIVKDNLDAGKHSCEINALERDTKYRFRVIAFNSGGASKPSSASEVFPQTRLVQKLKRAPQIIKLSKRTDSILLEWMYEDAIGATVEGYSILYRPSDKDSERDYQILPINDPIATSYTVTDLTPGMQYDIKITAFNSKGNSPPSTVATVDLPHSGKKPISNNHEDSYVNKPGNHNNDRLQRVKQKDIIYLIIGGVLGLIVVVLVLSVFCYWRQKAKWNNNKGAPVVNGNGAIRRHSPDPNVMMPKYTSVSSNQTPTDTKCSCSRHHSDHSSLERDGAHPYHGKHHYPYIIPGDKYSDSPQNSPSYPHIHSNPMNLYMEYRAYPQYFQGTMSPPPPYLPIGRFVRGSNGNGNLCHMIPGDFRKMSSEAAMEQGVGNFGNGGAMVMRRFQGNMSNGMHDGVRRQHEMENFNEVQNNNYSDNDIVVHAAKAPCDSNSDEATTSGVVTHSDEALSQSSQLSQDVSEEDIQNKRHSKHSSSEENVDEETKLKLVHDESDNNSAIGCEEGEIDIDEKSSFLNVDKISNNYRKETIIT